MTNDNPQDKKQAEPAVANDTDQEAKLEVKPNEETAETTDKTPLGATSSDATQANTDAAPSNEDTIVPEDAEMETVTQDQYDHLRSGQTIRLHLKVTEGKKDRIQIFEGMILGVRGASVATRTITVRKQSKGYGVEKIIPLASPVLDKIEVVKHAKVRRSKLYYLRNYKKRLRETMVVDK